jgi:hypothetical protein
LCQKSIGLRDPQESPRLLFSPGFQFVVSLVVDSSSQQNSIAIIALKGVVLAWALRLLQALSKSSS